MIMGELASFSQEMAKKPMLWWRRKWMSRRIRSGWSALAAAAGEAGLEFFPISAVTGKGIEQLKARMAKVTELLPADAAEPARQR